MPVRRKTTIERTIAEGLVDRRYTEWQNPQEGAAEPVIIMESPGSSRRVSHIYVVWSDWRDMTPLERSQVIMRAYERLHGREHALDVTVSMGLTPDEANRMGIHFE